MVFGDEACDDGNQVNTDGCLNSCAVARCGDSVARSDIEAGEEGYENCDDGNQVNADACRNNCVAGVCGDGIQRIDGANREACDDSNTNNGDGCSSECALELCGNGRLIRARTVMMETF
jgi:cysteine-rich repeat protein